MRSLNFALLLLVGFVSFIGEAVKFTLTIPGLQKKCFYEMLGQTQKYSLETIPKNEPKYELEVEYSVNGKWEPVYYKMTTLGYQRIDIHKLSTMATTHSFCIKNIQRQILNIIVKFHTGAELMDFELLPDKSDAENLEKEVLWLQDQKKGLYETISGIQQLKSSTISTSKLLSTKIIVFAVIGLIGVVGVNYLFYIEVKKTFKDRKLI